MTLFDCLEFAPVVGVNLIPDFTLANAEAHEDFHTAIFGFTGLEAIAGSADPSIVSFHIGNLTG